MADAGIIMEEKPTEIHTVSQPEKMVGKERFGRLKEVFNRGKDRIDRLLYRFEQLGNSAPLINLGPEASDLTALQAEYDLITAKSLQTAFRNLPDEQAKVYESAWYRAGETETTNWTSRMQDFLDTPLDDLPQNPTIPQDLRAFNEELFTFLDQEQAATKEPTEQAAKLEIVAEDFPPIQKDAKLVDEDGRIFRIPKKQVLKKGMEYRDERGEVVTVEKKSKVPEDMVLIKHNQEFRLIAKDPTKLPEDLVLRIPASSDASAEDAINLKQRKVWEDLGYVVDHTDVDTMEIYAYIGKGLEGFREEVPESTMLKLFQPQIRQQVLRAIENNVPIYDVIAAMPEGYNRFVPALDGLTSEYFDTRYITDRAAGLARVRALIRHSPLDHGISHNKSRELFESLDLFLHDSDRPSVTLAATDTATSLKTTIEKYLEKRGESQDNKQTKDAVDLLTQFFLVKSQIDQMQRKIEPVPVTEQELYEVVDLYRALYPLASSH